MSKSGEPILELRLPQVCAQPWIALYAVTYNLINLEINYPFSTAFIFYEQLNKLPNFFPAIKMSLPLDSLNSTAQVMWF